MFTERSLRTGPLAAASAALKDQLTGCMGNTCPINSVCRGSETATAATAPVEESASGRGSTQPGRAEETLIIHRAKLPLLNVATYVLSLEKQRHSGHSLLDLVLAGLLVTK